MKGRCQACHLGAPWGRTMGLARWDLWLGLLTLQGRIPKPDLAMPGQEKDKVPYIYPMAGSTEPPHIKEEGSLVPQA